MRNLAEVEADMVKVSATSTRRAIQWRKGLYRLATRAIPIDT